MGCDSAANLVKTSLVESVEELAGGVLRGGRLRQRSWTEARVVVFEGGSCSTGHYEGGM